MAKRAERHDRMAMGLLAVLLLAACGKDAPAPTAAATKDPAAPVSSTPDVAAAPSGIEAANLSLLQSYLAAWNAHDIAAASMFFDEQGDYFDAAFAGMQHGRSAIAENAIGVFMRGVPDLHWEVRSKPIVGSEGVAYEWTLTGTNTGTWGGVRATRQKIQLKGMSFMRIRNGKILYQSAVYDSAALNRQLGL